MNSNVAIIMPHLNSSLFFRLFITFSLAIPSLHLTGQVQYINFRHYSLSDGLSSYKVVKVLQDRFGFMWVATQDGLNRFDGKGIIIYNKSAGEKHLLLGSDITDMLEDTSRNILWVISSYGGLNGIDLKTGVVKYAMSVDDSASRFTNRWLKTLIQNKDELWIGTFDGITVYNIREGRFKTTVSIPFQRSSNSNNEFDINLFHQDEFGRIWAFVANYGMVIYSGHDNSVLLSHPLAELRFPTGFIAKRVSGCKNISPQQILLATHKGIKKISYDKNGLISVPEEMMSGTDGKAIRYLNFDSDGNLWIATNEGLYRSFIKEGTMSSVEDVNIVDQKKWISSVNDIFFDRHNNLWLGTLQGFAVATRTHSPFLHYFQSADLKAKISRAFFIFPYNDSVEYVCAEDGFYRVDNTKKNIQRLKGGPFWFMFRHKDGNLFLGTDNRLFSFQPPDQFIDIEKIYPELSPISHEFIMGAVNWNDSLVYMGSKVGNGIYEWNYKRRILAKLDSHSSVPLKNGIVNSIYKDKRNRIWILSNNSFAVYNPHNHQLDNYELTNPETGQPLTFFFDMCEASGSYWLASYGSGIIQMDDSLRIKNIISTNQGMANAGLYKIFPVNDTLLFCTSNNGLSKINIRNSSVANYFQSDGLHSNAFEELCGTVYKGKIYAGGPDGFTIIDPKYITTNTIAPELYINNIVIETQSGRQELSDLQMKSATLPRNLLQATIYFSALNYTNPERTTYAYRIKGQQEEWVNLGTQNFVNLIGLKPDTYTLQVKAINEDSYASEIKEIQLIFLPKWYQTFWFKALAVLLALGIIYFVYKVRINQLKKEREIRTHLASDLHDDLGSTLNSVKVYANMALLEKENHSYLEKVKESTQEAITGVRDIIWVLDDKKDLLDHLLTRIKAFAAPLCEAHHINFQQQINDSLLNYKLGKEEKRNLYMIIKEAVNNSVKYAKGNSIYLTIEHTQNKLTIKLADDGIGFEKDKITEGNGLKNIMNRAIEIGYKATIISQPGQGTTIQLEKT
jgi:signal transduction histidine kinase/ligand-binding sensor domain-containing protein